MIYRLRAGKKKSLVSLTAILALGIVVLTFFLPPPSAFPGRLTCGLMNFFLLLYVYISLKLRLIWRGAEKSRVELSPSTLGIHLAPFLEISTPLDNIADARPVTSPFLTKAGVRTNFSSWLAVNPTPAGVIMLEFHDPIHLPIFRLLPCRVKRLILAVEDDKTLVAEILSLREHV